MLDIGFWELALIFVIALLVAGPERLPRMARTLGAYMAWLRGFLRSVRSEVEREMNEADAGATREVSRLKKELGSQELERTREELKGFRDSVERGGTPPPAESSGDGSSSGTRDD